MSSRWINLKQIDREAINHLIRGLEDFEKSKSIKDGLAAGGHVFVAGGKRRLKQRMKSGSKGVTGNLLGSFRTRVAKDKPMMFAGFTGKGAHSHLVDNGTTIRFRKRMGGFIRNSRSSNTTTGRMIGNHFWNDTASGDYPQALDKVYEGIEKAVNRINNRR